MAASGDLTFRFADQLGGLGGCALSGIPVTFPNDLRSLLNGCPEILELCGETDESLIGLHGKAVVS